MNNQTKRRMKAIINQDCRDGVQFQEVQQQCSPPPPPPPLTKMQIQSK